MLGLDWIGLDWLKSDDELTSYEPTSGEDSISYYHLIIASYHGMV